MTLKPNLDIDLRAKTIWLRNIQLISATCEDRASLFEYIAELAERDADLRFTVDDLKISFYCDIPLTSFFEDLLKLVEYAEDYIQEEIVKGVVIETLKAGLYEKILAIATKALADSEAQ